MINSCLCAYISEYFDDCMQVWACVSVCVYMRQSRNYNKNSLHKQKAPVKHIRNHMCVCACMCIVERDTHTHTHTTWTTAKPAAQICAAIECDQSVLYSVAFFRLNLSVTHAQVLWPHYIAVIKEQLCVRSFDKRNITVCMINIEYDSISFGFRCYLKISLGVATHYTPISQSSKRVNDISNWPS